MSASPPPMRMHHVVDSVPGRPRVSVLSWNTLADGLAQNGNFSRAPKEALDWAHRLPLLLSELYRHDADIVALQEVNRYEAFADALGAHGYAGAFSRKAFSACSSLGFPVDGVALFYRQARFKPMLAPQAGVFTAADGSTLSQCWLSLLLLDKEAQKPLLVATTHLKAKDDFEEMRLVEARQLSQLLRSQLTSTGGPTPALVLCGDFNAPLEASCCQQVATSLGLVHTGRSVPPEKAFSTWKYRSTAAGELEKCCVIDHMWHCPQQLRHITTRSQPTKAECGEGALPNAAYPSDHIAQLNVFEWR
jgi:mRNA deadenylase 3'-5' endonuclease subunit Ccr4